MSNEILKSSLSIHECVDMLHVKAENFDSYMLKA